jgi:hypothetical protein
MKAIEPVQIWANGSVQTGNFINAYIINDNLQDTAQFYWGIYTEETLGILLSQGNLILTGEDYLLWDTSNDINQAAYDWICFQLNLTLIP